MRRRCFGSLAFPSALLLGFSISKALAGVPPGDLAGLLGTLTDDAGTAARLGASCLATVEARRLAETQRRLGRLGPTRPHELRRAIAELAGEDLARRDLVVVDGWVLARAEAEALALLHLARGG